MKKKKEHSKAHKALSATVTGAGALAGTIIAGPAGALMGTAITVYLNDDIVDRLVAMRQAEKRAVK